MPKKRQMKLVIESPADHFYIALGPKGRETLDTWFEYLRNWNIDPFARNHSKRLKQDEEFYALRTPDSNLILAFRIEGNTIFAVTVFEEEWLKVFEESQKRVTA